MQLAHYHLASIIGGLAAILTMGCSDSTAPPPPTTGAILVTVSTEGAGTSLPDGYTLVIDLGPAQAIPANGVMMISDLPKGTHFVRLDALGQYCSVTGENPRSVNVVSGTSQSPIAVDFFVSCHDPFPWNY